MLTCSLADRGSAEQRFGIEQEAVEAADTGIPRSRPFGPE